MATSDREVLRILAKHVTWQDEGDRGVVADYFGRDADDPDAFRPFDQDDEDRENARRRDNQTDSDINPDDAGSDQDDKNETDDDKTGTKLSSAKTNPTPATAAKPGSRR
jgi:hypothetical protein